jgi:hypothetical protein
MMIKQKEADSKVIKLAILILFQTLNAMIAKSGYDSGLSKP